MLALMSPWINPRRKFKRGQDRLHFFPTSVFHTTMVAKKYIFHAILRYPASLLLNPAFFLK
jgi:hypothetical protein